MWFQKPKKWFCINKNRNILVQFCDKLPDRACAVFNWVTKVITQLLWLWFYDTQLKTALMYENCRSVSLVIDGLGLNELQLEKRLALLFKVPTFSFSKWTRTDHDWFLSLVLFCKWVNVLQHGFDQKGQNPVKLSYLYVYLKVLLRSHFWFSFFYISVYN